MHIHACTYIHTYICVLGCDQKAISHCWNGQKCLKATEIEQQSRIGIQQLSSSLPTIY